MPNPSSHTVLISSAPPLVFYNSFFHIFFNCVFNLLVMFQNLNPQRKKKTNILAYVTCAVYNHNGSEILASYNDDDIYLFDTAADW